MRRDPGLRNTLLSAHTLLKRDFFPPWAQIGYFRLPLVVASKLSEFGRAGCLFIMYAFNNT